MKKILAFLLLILLSFSYLSAQNTNKPHSAKKASTLSAILPGAGQVYNKQAWKIPIIYAFLLFMPVQEQFPILQSLITKIPLNSKTNITIE